MAPCRNGYNPIFFTINDVIMNTIEPNPATPLNPPAAAAPGHMQDDHGIPDSGDVTGIELRMLPPLVRDNQTIKFWPFPGRARLYCLTMVVSDVANQLVGLMDLNGFQGIGDDDYLPINKTIYYWQDGPGPDKAPDQLHLMCSVIKSKEALRETGDILSSIKNDHEYQDLLGRLASIVADTASVATVANLTTRIASIAGRYMGRIDDRPIGTVVHSFTRLHGDWDRLGITPVSLASRNVNFQFELIVRDNLREQQPASSLHDCHHFASSHQPAVRLDMVHM
jgi:hypothetical protein